MWLLLAFLSASLLGLYDVAKKRAVTANAVLPVLLLNTLFSTLLFAPMLLSAECGFGWCSAAARAQFEFQGARPIIYIVGNDFDLY